MRIAVISDTHVPQARPGLPEDLIEKLQGVDRILHAGDLASLGVLNRLLEIAPTTAVAGNIDPPEVRAKLSDREVLRLAGRTIGLSHGHQPHRIQDRYIGSGYDDADFDLFYL
ncbi:MAG: metallophosphoesterase family protein, partial [Candidatus Bipolaricaulia bacterium]